MVADLVVWRVSASAGEQGGALELGLSIPLQRRIVALTMVRLEFGPDIWVECPHAPSPSVSRKNTTQKTMKTNLATANSQCSLARDS